MDEKKYTMFIVEFLVLIGMLIGWPWRMLKIIMRAPNIEVILKNGTRIRLFVYRWNVSAEEVGFYYPKLNSLFVNFDSNDVYMIRQLY